MFYYVHDYVLFSVILMLCNYAHYNLRAVEVFMLAYKAYALCSLAECYCFKQMF